MDNELNRVTVTIYGEDYTIRGTEEKDHIETTAQMVDEKMAEIGERLPELSLSRVAVLAAINLADELLKAEERNERLTGMLEEEWERRKEEAARKSEIGVKRQDDKQAAGKPTKEGSAEQADERP